jgi:[protein-PII] uridylyltransferase
VSAATTPSDSSAAREERLVVIDDQTLRGSSFTSAYTAVIDRWLRSLFHETFNEGERVALVATGGHGRQELCPASDLDLMLIHEGGITDERSHGLWYPIWDEGLKLGHSVRTVAETLDLAKADLPTATTLLSTRHLAGDATLTEQVAINALAQWRKHSQRWMRELGSAVAQRHAVSEDEVAFALEPDLKEGRGGLRDVHALRWAYLAELDVSMPSPATLGDHYEILLATRVELHRTTARKGDRLLLQEQDGVADALGYESADALMKEVAGAGRAIAWASTEAWYSIEHPRPKGLLRRSKPQEVGPGLTFDNGYVRFDSDHHLDAFSVLRIAVEAARRDARIDAPSLERAASAPPLPDPWPERARELLVELLSAGPAAVDVIETLDLAGLWLPMIPEWEPNRSRPQRNAYHRFTVDRHLLECVAVAAGLANRVARPDLLLVGALLHDIGKGYPGDHSVVGRPIANEITTRMGFEPIDVETIGELVEHHLLLPDVATRRDLDDPSTLRYVAAMVGTQERLELLWRLSEADSIATGPNAWGRWKEGLIETLVARVDPVIAGADASSIATPQEPSTAQRNLVEQARTSGDLMIVVEGDSLTLVGPDRAGTFSRVAGVLALHGLDVLAASATAIEGIVVDEFRVTATLSADIPWNRVELDIRRALRGRLALDSRLADRARTYRRGVVPPSSMHPDVRILNEASEDSTVVEVLGRDEIGLLYRLTRALADLDLDILRARVTTIGQDAIDAFYVRDSDGAKLSDPQDLAEVRLALLHVLQGP